MTREVQFPDGTTVRASALPDRREDDEWRQFGLYADKRWAPSWPHETIEWKDSGIPDRFEEAVRQICRAFDVAWRGEHVEVGCAGGIGRTGDHPRLYGGPRRRSEGRGCGVGEGELQPVRGRARSSGPAGSRSAGSSGLRTTCTAAPLRRPNPRRRPPITKSPEWSGPWRSEPLTAGTVPCGVSDSLSVLPRSR